MDKSFAVRGPPFELRLSHWDKRMTPLYSKRLLCFSLPNNNYEQNEFIVDILLKALQSTVKELPFLAGSIVPFSKEQPWLRDIRPDGAAYLETKDLTKEISFSDLRNAHFAPSLLDVKKLCPFPKAVYGQEDVLDVCRIRANFVNGGLILVVSILHTVCDGRGITEVIKVFAQKICQMQKGGLKGSVSAEHEATARDVYRLDRSTLLYGKGVGCIEDHPCWTASPIKSFVSFPSGTTHCVVLRIDGHSMDQLKSVASSDLSDTYISTQDAVAALIWRSTMLARFRAGIIKKDAMTHLAMPIDCRSRLNLSEPYHGNAIYGIAYSRSLQELLGDNEFDDDTDIPKIVSLQTSARIIRQGIICTTEDKFRDLLAFVERTNLETQTRLSYVDDLAFGSLFLTSYFRFGTYELDFGATLGDKIEAFRLPSEGLVPGMPVILPRLPDGSCEFAMTERADVVKYVLEDATFRRFVHPL